jgi:uncharacterized protein YndB with AHSA1/START domain
MTAPLRVTFDVRCPPDRAFWLWTEGIGRWWPADHTVSGDPAAVVLEAGVGGRIYEREADGTEHDWGLVTEWQPPFRLGYRWHIGRPPGQATHVEVQFVSREHDTTLVEIVHRGWEVFGTEAAGWQDRNRAGWESVLHRFQAAARSSLQEMD